MTDTSEGIATEVSGPTLAETNFNSFEAAFQKAVEANPAPAENDAIPQQPTAPASEPKAKAVPAGASPQEESEFPPEMMGKEPAATEQAKDDLDEIQPSAKMGQESRSNFDKLKSIAKEARVERDRFKAELEAAKSKPAIVADSEALKQAHDRLREMEQTLERSNFQMSPKFKAIITEKNQAIEDAKAYVVGSDIDPAVIEMAARVTGPNRVKILRDAGIDPETIASISPYLAHADRKERESAAAMEQSASLRQEWELQEQQRAEQQKAQIRAEEDRVYSEVGKRVSEVFAPFKKVPGAEKWNAQVESLSAEAKEFFNGKMTVDRMAEIAYYGVGAKVVDKMYNALKGENKALRDQLAKLTAAQPSSAGSSNTKSEVRPPGNPDELKSHLMNAFDREMGRV
jgi:hypothetical protein